MPDVSAFSDIVADAGVCNRALTVIADKGFESELNEALLDDTSPGYVIAVRRSCAEILETPSSPDKFQKVFMFRRHAIYCNDYQSGKDRLFLYYDMSLANEEAVDLVSRRKKANSTIERRREAEEHSRRRNRGCLSQEESVDVAETLQANWDNGMFILKPNRPDINCVQEYCLYKNTAALQVTRRHTGRGGQLHCELPVILTLKAAWFIHG